MHVSGVGAARPGPRDYGTDWRSPARLYSACALHGLLAALKGSLQLGPYAGGTNDASNLHWLCHRATRPLLIHQRRLGPCVLRSQDLVGYFPHHQDGVLNRQRYEKSIASAGRINSGDR